MHPNPRFHADGDLLEAAATIGLAHVFVGTPVPMVVHAPVTRHGDALRFHVARVNRAAPHLDGAVVLLTVVGVHGYVSPTWYESDVGQVPTWNYAAVEIEGRCASIDEPALIEQLDALAARHEPDGPGGRWTLAKVDPARIAAMLGAIRGFELRPVAIRGTTKFSQNKTATDRAGIIAGLRTRGDHALADAVRDGGAARGPESNPAGR